MGAGRNIKGITVEIGGDTTGLNKALSGVTREIKSTQSELKDVERLLKMDPGNMELLAQKQRLLTDAVDDTKDKLETLKQAKQQADDQFSRGDISQGQYDALQREIVETEQNLKNLEDQAKKTEGSISGISKAAENVKKIGDASTVAGKKMLPVTAAVGAVGIASGKMALDFEDAMAKVNTIADTAEVPLSDLEKSIIDLSNETGISSSEIADNVYNAISAGQKTGDAVNFVANSSKLAKAGFSDAGSALDILTTVMNAYGLEASEVNRVSDVLIQTQNLGKTTVGELASSMGKIIPTAKANGVALEQVASGYAIMTSNGVATAESTTYMNSMLNELGKSGTKVSDTLKEKTGQSFQELMQSGSSLSDVLQIISNSAKDQGLAFGDLWGSAEAGKAGLILLGDSANQFNSTLSDMQNATGATDTAFNKLNTTSYSIGKAINNLKNTAIELGSAVMSVVAPMIETLVEKIKAFSIWFSGLSEGSKKIIVVIGMIVAAVGPVLIIIGKIATGIGAVMSLVSTIGPVLAGVGGAIKGVITAIAAAASPVTIIIAVIAALVAGFIYLWNTSEGFRNFWIGLWEGIKAIVSAAIDGVVNFLTQTLPGAWNSVVSFFAGIPAWWNNLWQGIFNKISEVWSNIVSAVKEKAIAIKDGIVNGIQAAIEFITSLPSKALQWGADIVAGIANGIKKAIGKITDAVGDIANKIKSFLHFSVPDEGPLTDFESWMPDFIDGLAKGLRDSRGVLDRAVSDIAGSMMITPQYSLAGMYGSASAPAQPAPAPSTATSGQEAIRDIIIPVQIGNKKIDDIVISAQTRHNFRSGGR